MNILYASNDGFARHLGTSLCSLLEHNQKTKELNIYIFSMGMSQKNQDGLRQIAERYHRELMILELGNLHERFSGSVDTGGFDISIMGRLFMGELLPETIERVLYLDCDTVVLHSLEHLWKQDLKGNVMGAVMEPTIYPEVKASIDLALDEPYYNSGILLVDLNRWREEEIQKKLFAFLQSKGGKLFAGDQDALNGTLRGKILPLMPRWNFFTNYRYFHYQDLLRHASWYEVVSPAEWKRAKKHPVILHYMGDERPWIAGNLNHYRRAYEKYLAQTCWAKTPKQEGKRLYMLAYHLLDYTTAICPAVRWEVSRRLGMRMVNARKEKKG